MMNEIANALKAVALTNPNGISNVLLIGMVIGAIVALIVAHRGDNTFRLVDLLMENGRASKWAVIIMGSWSIHSWALIRWTIDGNVTTADFAAYGAVWVSPLIAKMFVKNGETHICPPRPAKHEEEKK